MPRHWRGGGQEHPRAPAIINRCRWVDRYHCLGSAAAPVFVFRPVTSSPCRHPLRFFHPSSHRILGEHMGERKEASPAKPRSPALRQRCPRSGGGGGTPLAAAAAARARHGMGMGMGMGVGVDMGIEDEASHNAKHPYPTTLAKTFVNTHHGGRRGRGEGSKREL